MSLALNIAAASATITAVKSDFSKATTPEIKRQICKSAREIAAAVLDGIWEAVVIAFINILEATIKDK